MTEAERIYMEAVDQAGRVYDETVPKEIAVGWEAWKKMDEALRRAWATYKAQENKE